MSKLSLGAKRRVVLTREPLVAVIALLDLYGYIEPGQDIMVVLDDEVLEKCVEAADDHQEESSRENVVPHDYDSKKKADKNRW
jgi:hypothetical protein